MLSTLSLHWLTSDQGLFLILKDHLWLGILLIALIVFCETGLVVMPFLPGDSLLFATGSFIGLAQLSPIVPIIVIALAAIIGDNTNYLIGRSRLGQSIIKKNWVKPHHLAKAQEFYRQHGSKAIILSRFIPIVRTLTPFTAGMAQMNQRHFTFYNMVGGTIWVGGFISLGYWLCHFAWVQNHISLLSLIVIVLSLMPVAIALIKELKKRKNYESVTR
jgi:membrane-associated protein